MRAAILIDVGEPKDVAYRDTSLSASKPPFSVKSGALAKCRPPGRCWWCGWFPRIGNRIDWASPAAPSGMPFGRLSSPPYNEYGRRCRKVALPEFQIPDRHRAAVLVELG